MTNSKEDALAPEEGATIDIVYPDGKRTNNVDILAEYEDFAVVYEFAPVTEDNVLPHNEYLVINKRFNTVDFQSPSYVQAVIFMVQMSNILGDVQEALGMYSDAKRAEESGIVVPNKKISVPDGPTFN